MNNIDNIINYVFMGVLILISLWGTYVLTKPSQYDDDIKDAKCKCSK